MAFAATLVRERLKRINLRGFKSDASEMQARHEERPFSHYGILYKLLHVGRISRIASTEFQNVFHGKTYVHIGFMQLHHIHANL